MILDTRWQETDKVREMRLEAQRIKEQLEAEKAAERDTNRERRDVIVEARQGVKVAVEKVILPTITFEQTLNPKH